MIVRPDLLRVGFSMYIDDIDPSDAMRMFRWALDTLTLRLDHVARGTLVSVRNASFGSGSVPDTKILKSSEPRATIDGQLELELASAYGLERAALVCDVCSVLRGLIVEGRRQKTAIQGAFMTPTAVVRNPEQYRDALLQQWFDRVGQVMQRARQIGAPVVLTDTAAPTGVTQHPMTLMEVELRLELAGRLVAARQGATTESPVGPQIVVDQTFAD